MADGIRPDTLAAAIDDGTLPALARMRSEGAFHTITTAFPSVTGPAYAPFIMGRFPGQAGLPGLRWYDRTRATCGWPAYARSYVGAEMRHVDRDLTPSAPTLFELAPSSLGALSVIGRGLAATNRLDRTLRFAARAARTHFRGDINGWLAIDRDMGDRLVRRVRAERPAFTFAAFTGVDKTSHSAGHGAPIVRDALQIVDDVAARLRSDAERDGVWETTHLWIVSDHGHSPVTHHDDLADALRALGVHVVAHPRIFTRRPDVAVMVSGNAMAHLYVALDERARPYWNALRERPVGRTSSAANSQFDGTALLDWLLDRPSVDLAIVPTSPRSCDIHTRTRGTASLAWVDGCYRYTPITGDPIAIGVYDDLSAESAYDVTLDSDYPDALVQIAAICAAPRSGDIIISATREWDYRARYEPIPHVSSHGALHRDHMLVPLLTNHPIAAVPRRTVDVMPSAADVLGVHAPNVDGVSFMSPRVAHQEQSAARMSSV